MMTVPTDCDQRDERLGWMGDADLSVDSMLLNYGAADFFSSYAHSINDELGSDGSLPDTVPFVRYGNRPADVSWSAALPQIAWALYKYNGDLSVAKRCQLMIRWHRRADSCVWQALVSNCAAV